MMLLLMSCWVSEWSSKQMFKPGKSHLGIPSRRASWVWCGNFEATTSFAHWVWGWQCFNFFVCFATIPPGGYRMVPHLNVSLCQKNHHCSSLKLPTTAALVKFVMEKQTLIFHKSDQPKNGMGKIHAICLQLVATGILVFGIADNCVRSVGKNDINVKSIIVKLGNHNSKPRAMLDRYNTHFNVLNDKSHD